MCVQINTIYQEENQNRKENNKRAVKKTWEGLFTTGRVASQRHQRQFVRNEL